MKHPSPEEWVSLLYEELDPSSKARLRSHAIDCPSCAARWNAMQQTAKDLDAWRLRPAPAAPSAVSFRYHASRAVASAAAILLLGLCVGWVGRSWISSPGTVSAAELQDRLSGLETRLNARFADQLDELRAEDDALLAAALEKVEQRQVERVAILRREIAWMAHHTREGLQAAEETLAQLAKLVPSESAPAPNP